MRIYKLIFIAFYKARKSFRDDNNEIWAAGFVTMLQGIHIGCILILLILLGLPDIFVKAIPVILGIIVLLYILNLVYFFPSAKVQELMEADSLLNEREQKRNSNYAWIVIILTIIALFVIPEIGHLHHIKQNILANSCSPIIPSSPTGPSFQLRPSIR